MTAPRRRPARASSEQLAALEERLGHRFADAEVLREALSHSSAVMPGGAEASYQRLEFLGDRVLGLVIADMLTAAYPHATEGDLARRLTSLVRNETCAEIALEVGIAPYIRLGSGELASGGRAKAAILGDVCEAVIGALYRDGGLAVARIFIEGRWRPRMEGATGPLRDAKTTLQEWAQGRGLPTPAYAIAGRSGPHHAPRFLVTVTVEDIPVAEGEGRSRREAEQAAATAMLVREGVWKAAGA